MTANCRSAHGSGTVGGRTGRCGGDLRWCGSFAGLRCCIAAGGDAIAKKGNIVGACHGDTRDGAVS